MRVKKGPWRLILEPRNKHYRDADRESYERVMQRCVYVAGQEHDSDFVADIIVSNNPAGLAIAKAMASSRNLITALQAMCELWDASQMPQGAVRNIAESALLEALGDK